MHSLAYVRMIVNKYTRKRRGSYFMKIKNSSAILLVLAGGMLITACGGGKPKTTHTYNTFLSTKPTTWNVHTWQTSDESYIQGFCSMGFYDLQLNAAKDGYEFVTEMASDMPVDVSSTVTAEELEMYGYGGNIGDGYVWEIPLNRSATWEDGSEIKAADYIQSMKYQLEPKMMNYRADSYYASSMVIANAERYAKQGNDSLEEVFKYIDTKTGNWKANNVGKDGNIYFNVERPTSYVASIFSNVEDPEPFWTLLRQPGAGDPDDLKLAAERIKDAAIYYNWKYVDHENDEHKSDWDEIEGYGKLSSVKEEMLNHDIEINEFDDREVLVRSKLSENTEETAEVYSLRKFKADVSKVVANYSRNNNTNFNWKFPLFVNVHNDYEQTWGDEEGATSGVGLVQVDPYKIRIYLAKPMTALDLKFSLTGTWLVNNDLYKKLMTTREDGSVITTYATPKEGVKGYMSYGPYKLTAFEAGKEFKMERNDKWYGYTDGKHEGQFAIDVIYTKTIQEHKVALQEFLAGRLDDIDLTRADMKEYGASSRLTRTFESYTQKISFNSDRASLLERQQGSTENFKTVLANKNFREGLSLALDRKNFAAQATSGSKGFTGLLNDLYLTDVEDGEMYRNTEQGMSVYSRVYGKLGGNPYASNYVESALHEDLIGYNMDMATYYVEKGLTEELASTETGHIEKSNKTKIALDFRVYDNKSEATIEMYNFIKMKFDEVLANAVAKLKEKGILGASDNITFDIQLTKDEDYYTTATKGGYDMIFSTWGGASINPQGLMEVYCKAEYQQTCEFGFKGKQDRYYVEIDADGNGTIDESENQSVDKWYADLMNITETDEKGTPAWTAKHQRMLNILSGLEVAILNRFEAVPLVARASSSLNSFKIENGTDHYINLIGYGGIRHIRFNMNDGEWANFVKKNNYDLSSNYKD